MNGVFERIFVLSTIDPSKAAKIVCYRLTPESPLLADLRVRQKGGQNVRWNNW